MPKKRKNDQLNDKKVQIVTLFGVIPVMRIVHKIKIKETKGNKFLRYSKMYWLFGIIPLFMTERDYE